MTRKETRLSTVVLSPGDVCISNRLAAHRGIEGETTPPARIGETGMMLLDLSFLFLSLSRVCVLQMNLCECASLVFFFFFFFSFAPLDHFLCCSDNKVFQMRLNISLS